MKRVLLLSDWAVRGISQEVTNAKKLLAIFNINTNIVCRLRNAIILGPIRLFGENVDI